MAAVRPYGLGGASCNSGASEFWRFVDYVDLRCSFVFVLAFLRFFESHFCDSACPRFCTKHVCDAAFQRFCTTRFPRFNATHFIDEAEALPEAATDANPTDDISERAPITVQASINVSVKTARIARAWSSG